MRPAADFGETEVQRVSVAPQELGNEGGRGDHGGEDGSVYEDVALLDVKDRESGL